MVIWKLLETLAVRMTGFPIERLTELRFTRTVVMVRQILTCDKEIARLRHQLLKELFPAAVHRAHQELGSRPLLVKLSAWRRTVGRGCAVGQLEVLPPTYHELYTLLGQWDELLEQQTTLLVKGQATWQKELASQRRRLWQIVADVDVQEAIFLSSISMYQELQRYLGNKEKRKIRSSATRKFERRLIAYLQRLCTKNETHSFFGPINYGRLDSSQPMNLHLCQGAEPLRRRVTFPSYWMAESIAEVMSREATLRPFLRPRRNPACLLRGDQLVFPASGRLLTLEPTTVRLFELADGTHTVVALAEKVAEAWTRTEQRIEQLEQQGALVTNIIVPADLSNPLAYLQAWLSDIPEAVPTRAHWCGFLQEIHDAVNAFATADLPQRVHILAELEARFTALCGRAARRGQGRMYADRILLFEECLGNLETCVLGNELATMIATHLQPILRLWYVYGRLQAQQDQRTAYDIWHRLLPEDGTGVPFLAYLQAILHNNQQAAARASLPALDDFLSELKALIWARSDGHCAYLRAAELPNPPVPSDPKACDCCSLDLLIVAPSLVALETGDFQLVLGEGHSQPLTWVFPTAYFLDNDDTLLAEPLWTGLATQPGYHLAAQIAFTRNSKIYPYPLPGALIELRPRYPDCRAISMASVEVRKGEADQLQLWADGHEWRLYPPLKRREKGVDPLAPFAFTPMQPLLVDLGEHTPRIEIEGVIYQRERWRLSAESLHDLSGQGFELFLATWRWKERHALPKEFFVHATHEPKPLYIDLSNYFLVELLHYLARRSDHLTIIEMLPNSQQLWLERQGEHHCCEFRIIAVA